MFGYEHIHRRHAARFDTFRREYLNPFLNYHRPCLFATELADPKKPGRIKRVYRARDAMTPLDKLTSLPDGPTYLRAGVTLHELHLLATALSDIQAAEELNEARQALYRRAPLRTGCDQSLTPAGAAGAVDMWTRRLNGAGQARGQRGYTLPTVQSLDHMPTALHHHLKVQEPRTNTLPRSTTDRLASRRRSQGASGSYLNWKRLGSSGRRRGRSAGCSQLQATSSSAISGIRGRTAGVSREKEGV